MEKIPDSSVLVLNPESFYVLKPIWEIEVDK